jgi:hypothetical protein
VYDTLITENSSVVQQVAQAPVHRPTPSPRKRVQDTLTQIEWGARPIPAGWSEHTDGGGCKFFYNRRTQQWATSYEQMFQEPTPPSEEILTQRSPPNSQDSGLSRDSSSYKIAKLSSKPLKKRREEREVDTQMLPGSESMIPRDVTNINCRHEVDSEPSADEQSQISDSSRTVW